jgi:hypothetical protein
MARFLSHPLGVDLRSVLIALEPAWIKASEAIKRLSVTTQNENAGQVPICKLTCLPDASGAVCRTLH